MATFHVDVYIAVNPYSKSSIQHIHAVFLVSPLMYHRSYVVSSPGSRYMSAVLYTMYVNVMY